VRRKGSESREREYGRGTLGSENARTRKWKKTSRTAGDRDGYPQGNGSALEKGESEKKDKLENGLKEEHPNGTERHGDLSR